MDSTSLEIISSYSLSCQDKEQQEECGFESESDAYYSSSSDDDNESMADSDSFFNIEALNQEEDDQEGYSYTTGDGRAMKDIEEDDNETAAYRGAKKEKETAEDKNGVKDENEISERVRKREEDKAFWEACLASGY
ncbi:hypothetical protein FCM35_KLT09303 [Carex littledalei]|uniref:Uncharacterized protein n=1 Tax=Carex littledalei TaxID=544730 RepID=A0A833QNM4_9POAL|nr:hypothetical protein FCM35_KLT09303 [Carex littledalei]